MKTTTYEGWDIDRSKYPLEKLNNNDVVTIVVEDFAPSMKVIFYKKNDLNLFYFRHGTICWQPINWEGDISIFKVFKSVIATIEKYIKDNNIKGDCGFELSRLKKLDNVIEYLLNKRGIETEIKDNFLLTKR